MGQVPLVRALSKLGIASRSQTKQWIESGRITVRGRVVKDPLFLVVPEEGSIALDGKTVASATACTIMLYKPRGYVTTKSDEKSRKKVYDLLPVSLQHLHPVGRLDMATSGVLIMTTDTQLSHFLTCPENEISRTYTVSVKGKITPAQMERLSAGIEDNGELLKASKMILRKTSHKESHLIVELCEGKNREIRRMFEALGTSVIALKRVAFGKLNLGDLAPGKYKEITIKEII